MNMFDVYYLGTANLAAARIVARSARAALAIVATMTGTPAYYLKARKVTP